MCTFLGYLIEPVDVCGIARLRGPNLKVYELLEEDICFKQPRSIIYNEIVTVSFSYNLFIDIKIIFILKYF